MENQSKVITLDEVYEMINKLDIKSKYKFSSFSSYGIQVVFYSETDDRSVVVQLSLTRDIKETSKLRSKLRKTKPWAVFHHIDGVEISVCDEFMKSPKEEELLLNQFLDGRKVAALFREIAANYTALINYN